MGKQSEWVKSGGSWSHAVKYIHASGEAVILRIRIGGEWGLYTLYVRDKHCGGFRTLAEAIEAANAGR